jgi:hypothetical protein
MYFKALYRIDKRTMHREATSPPSTYVERLPTKLPELQRTCAVMHFYG